MLKTTGGEWWLGSSPKAREHLMFYDQGCFCRSVACVLCSTEQNRSSWRKPSISLWPGLIRGGCMVHMSLSGNDSSKRLFVTWFTWNPPPPRWGWASNILWEVLTVAANGAQKGAGKCLSEWICVRQSSWWAFKSHQGAVMWEPSGVKTHLVLVEVEGGDWI